MGSGWIMTHFPIWPLVINDLIFKRCCLPQFWLAQVGSYELSTVTTFAIAYLWKRSVLKLMKLLVAPCWSCWPVGVLFSLLCPVADLWCIHSRQLEDAWETKLYWGPGRAAGVDEGSPWAAGCAEGKANSPHGQGTPRGVGRKLISAMYGVSEA